MISFVIRMRVMPEKKDRFLEIIHGIVAAMEGNEPETRIYAFWRTKTPNEYMLIESHRSVEALKFHIGQHIAVQDELLACLSEPLSAEELGEDRNAQPGNVISMQIHFQPPSFASI